MRRQTNRNRRFTTVSMFWLLPNMLTIAGLVSGLTSLRFALEGNWSLVIALITLGAVFDALDGRTARRFKTNSSFGAALDSLCDMVVFGVVPAICLYLWALQDSGNYAWAATMFYAASIALRLARFDSEIRDSDESSGEFFSGVPAPASAFLVLVPICVDLEFGIEWARNANWVSGWLVFIGCLAVSPIPTYAGKRIALPVGSVLPVMAGVSLMIAGVFIFPWMTYLALAGCYALSIPFSIRSIMRQKARLRKGA